MPTARSYYHHYLIYLVFTLSLFAASTLSEMHPADKKLHDPPTCEVPKHQKAQYVVTLATTVEKHEAFLSGKTKTDFKPSKLSTLVDYQKLSKIDGLPADLREAVLEASKNKSFYTISASDKNLAIIRKDTANVESIMCEKFLKVTLA
jgi:hypothetical protein